VREMRNAARNPSPSPDLRACVPRAIERSGRLVQAMPRRDSLAATGERQSAVMLFRSPHGAGGEGGTDLTPLSTIDQAAERLRKSRKWLQEWLCEHPTSWSGMPYHAAIGRTKLFYRRKYSLDRARNRRSKS